MPLAHQIILGVLVAGFILYPLVLFYGWVLTRGWEYGPDGVMPAVARTKDLEPEQPVEIVDREAA